MSAAATNGDERHDSPINDLILQTTLPTSSEFLNDDNDDAQKSPKSIRIFDSYARVISWLELPEEADDLASGKCRSEAKDKVDLPIPSPGVTSTTTVKPAPAVEPKDDAEKRLSSIDSSQRTPKTDNSSKENLGSESTQATSFNTKETVISNTEIRPSSASTFSHLRPSESASNYPASELGASFIQELQSRRINPKKARRRNAGLNFHEQASSRTPLPVGQLSSKAAGKRPVGCYGIGTRGGFPPVVSCLASFEPRPSTADREATAPSRTDSILQTESLLTKGTSDFVTVTPSPAGPEPSVSNNNTPNSESESLPTRENSDEAVPLPTTPASEDRDSGASSGTTVRSATLPSATLECTPHILQANNRNSAKRISLPIAFYATAPTAFGCYGDAVQISMTGNPLDHVVPLSDACPLLVGSLAVRYKLCGDMIDPEDPRVPNILKRHRIPIERVSRSDQQLLWQLAVHDDARRLANNTSRAPFSQATYWKRLYGTHSEVHLTLDNLLQWLKCEEQAHEHSERLRKRDFERLATCSTHSRDRMMSRRNQYDRESASLNTTELLPNNPAAVWQHIYRLLRCRGISEEALDREEYARIMTLPRTSRGAYVDTLVLKCRARTVDNAYLHSHGKTSFFIEERPVLQTTTRTASYLEEKDTIAALPHLTCFKRPTNCKRSTHSSNGGSRSKDWDTPLSKLPLRSKVMPVKPLLSDISLPRNYVPPNRGRQNRHFVVGKEDDGDGDRDGDGDKKGLGRRVSMSQFSQSTTESERGRRTRWGRFKRRVRMCLPPCCCG